MYVCMYIFINISIYVCMYVCMYVFNKIYLFFFSQIFCDFGESFVVSDVDGEQPTSVLVSAITKVIPHSIFLY